MILKNNGEIYLFVNKSKIQNLFKKRLLKINIIDENKIDIFLNNFVSKKIIIRSIELFYSLHKFNKK